MNKCFIFLSGALMGAAFSFFYLKKEYTKKYDAAIEYYYSNAPKTEIVPASCEGQHENSEDSTSVVLDEKQVINSADSLIVKKDYSNMKTIITKNNYSGKEETSESCMSDYYMKKAEAAIPKNEDGYVRPYRVDESEIEHYISLGYETLDLTFYEDMVLAETKSHEPIEEPSTTIGYDNYRHLMDNDEDLYIADDKKKMLYFINHSDEDFEEIY